MALHRAESRHRGEGLHPFRYGVLTDCDYASSAIYESQLDAEFLCRFEWAALAVHFTLGEGDNLLDGRRPTGRHQIRFLVRDQPT